MCMQTKARRTDKETDQASRDDEGRHVQDQTEQSIHRLDHPSARHTNHSINQSITQSITQLGLYRIADFTIRSNKNTGNSFYYSAEYE